MRNPALSGRVLATLALASVGCEFTGGTPTRPPPEVHTIMCAGMTDPIEVGSPTSDTYDCTILDRAKTYGHPDPMLVKAQIAQESAFNIFSTSLDSPCGMPANWTPEESKSFGLTQVTPACSEGSTLLLPNGHPNLEQDMSAPDWT